MVSKQDKKGEAAPPFQCGHSAHDIQWHLLETQRITHVGSWQIVLRNADEVVPGSHLWSDETFRLLGYEPGEVPVSLNLFYSHVHPEDLPIVEETLQRSINTVSAYDIEHRLVRKDGSVVVVHERGECTRYEGTEDWVKIIGTVRNITAQRESQRYEAILKSIFANTTMGYILLDAAFRIVIYNETAFVNAALLRGHQLAVGESILGYAAPDSRADLELLCQSVLQGGVHNYEHRFTRKDGSPLWCQIHLFPVQLDKTDVSGVAMSFEDITARKISDDLLRASQEKYRSFFMNSMNALFITERDGDILEVNPGACALFRMTEKELIEAGRFGLVEMDHPNLHIMLEERQRRGKTRGELQFVRKDGSSFPGILTSTAYVDADGAERTSMIIHDITEQKRAEADMQAKNEELHALMENLSNIREDERAAIAREIHDELGQQLTTLKMGVNIVNQKLNTAGLGDDHISGLLGEIDEAIKSVRRIASNLRPIILDYEGLEAALKWYASDFEKLHGISCHLDVDLPVDIENRRLSITLFRIFQETFTNIVRHAKASAVEVSMKLIGDEIVLTISDNGCGISSEKMNCKRTFGITGMKERVTMVHGRYSIERRPEGGTVTTVRVPYFPEEVDCCLQN